MSRAVPWEQVFEIENTVIDLAPRVKSQSVVKIRNLLYNVYISTEIKKLDGEADHGAEEGGDKGGENNAILD